MTFEIEIIAQQVRVSYYPTKVLPENRTYTELLKSDDFPYMHQLMKSKTVYFGVTASMNQNKMIQINNLKLQNIVMYSNSVTLFNARESYIAGSNFYYVLKSSSFGNQSLPIYRSSFQKLTFKIDDTDFTNKTDIKYDSFLNGLNITVQNLNKAGNWKFDLLWNNQVVDSRMIQIIPTTSQLFDVCYPEYNKSTGALLYNRISTQEYYYLEICMFDEFNNRKNITNYNQDDIIYVAYPNMISPINNDILITPSHDNSKFIVKIPLIAVGNYTLFNRLFINGRSRSFSVESNGVSKNFSIAYIEDQTAISLNSIASLVLKLKDTYSNNIDLEYLNKMNCKSRQSKVSLVSDNSEIMLEFSDLVYENRNIKLKFSPNVTGKYKFIPIIECGNSIPVNIECQSCEFSINNGEFNDQVFQFYSDYENSNKYSSSISKISPIYISLDEDNNKKLTEMLFLDKSLNKIIPSSDPKRFTGYMSSFTAKIVKYKNDNTVESSYNLNTNLNLASSVEFYIPSNEIKKRSELFSAIGSYKLEIQMPAIIATPTLSLSIKFNFIDEFLNNVSLFNAVSVDSNYLTLWIPQTKVVKANSYLNILKIIARNSDGNIVKGTDMNPDLLKVIFIDAVNQNKIITDFTSEKKKFGLFLYVFSKVNLAGNYFVKLTYNSDSNIIAKIPFTVESRNETYSLDYSDYNKAIISSDVKTSDTIQSIQLNDQIYGNGFSLIFKLKDYFGNLILNNFKYVYNSIRITNNSKAKIASGTDGILSITSNEDCGSYNITLSLLTGKQYVINWKVISNFSAISVDDFNVDLIDDPSIYAGNNIRVNIIYIRKMSLNNDEMTAFEKFVNNSIQIYAKSNKNLYPFSFFNRSGTNFTFISDQIKENDEYQIQAFKDDIQIVCGFCNFVVNPLDIIDRIQPYLIGNGEFIPLYENFSQIISFSEVSNRNLNFYLKKLDKFGNEIFVISKNTSRFLYSTTDPNNNTNFSLCSVEKTLLREHLEICKFYTAKITEDSYILDLYTLKYKLIITNNSNGSSDTPDKKNSFILNYDLNSISSNVDSEAIIIVDFRDVSNNRIIGLSSDKITISGIEVQSKVIVNTPDLGLVSIIFSNQKVVKPSDNIKLSIKYRGNIIIDNIVYVNNPGRLKNIYYTLRQVINKNFYIFQFKLEDNSKSIPDLYNNNVYRNDYFSSFLNVVNDEEFNIGYDYSYNHLSGIYTVIIKAGSYLTSILNFKYGLKGLTNETTKILIGKADNSKSFAYVTEGGSVSYPGDSVTITFKLLDSNGMRIDLDKRVSDQNLYIKVLVADPFNNIYQYLETKQFIYKSTDVNASFIYNYYIAGDYIFIPQLENDEISCIKCRTLVKNKLNDINLTKSKLFIKITDIGWQEVHPEESLSIFKYSLPFFNIKIKDSFGSNVNLDSLDKYTFKFASLDGKNTFNIIVFQTISNGILVYLNQTDRIKWQSIDSLTNMIFSIVDNNNQNNKIEFKKIFIFNSVLNQDSTKDCKEPQIPYLEEYQSNEIFIRAGNDYLLNFYLKACEKRITNFFDPQLISFIFEDPNIIGKYDIKIFPAERNGIYTAVISSKIARQDKAKLVLNKIKSIDELSINVLYNSIPFNYTIITRDSYSANHNFGSFIVQVKDNYDNLFTKENSLFLYNDIYLKVTYNKNLVNYKITYSRTNKGYLVQFPIIGKGEYVIENPYTTENKTIIVNEGAISKNSFFTLNSSDLSYIISIFQRDSNYNSISTKLDLKNFKIFYDSIDYVTQTLKTIQLNQQKLKITDNNIEIDKKLLPIGHFGFFSIKLSLNEDLIIQVGQQIVDINYSLYSFLSNGKLFNYFERNGKFFFDYGKPLPVFRSNLVDSSLQIILKKNSFEGNIALNFIPIVIGQSTYLMNSDSKCDTCQNLFMQLKLKDNIIYNISTPIIYQAEQGKSGEFDNDKFSIIGNYIMKFYVGQTGYFFVQARDVNGYFILIKPTFYISNPSNIIINNLPSFVDGVYLIEVQDTSNIMNNYLFSLLEGTQKNSMDLGLNLMGSFPVSFQFHNIGTGNLAKYNIIAQDKFKNNICNERLNIKISFPKNFLKWKIYKDLSENCILEANFVGSATFEYISYNKTELIYNKVIVLNSEDIPSIDYFYSKVYATENNIVSGLGSKVKFSIHVLSPLNYLYDLTVSLKIELRIYLINEINSRVLIKDSINCPFTCEFSRNVYGDYIIVTVVNGVELEKVTPLKYSRSFEQIPLTIGIKKNFEKPIINLQDSTVNSKFVQFTDKLTFPFSYLIGIINKDYEIILIPKNVYVTLNIRSYNDSISDKITLSFDAMKITEKLFLATLPSDKSTTFLHLPQGNYVLEFVVTGVNFNFKKAIPIIIGTIRNFQYPEAKYFNEADPFPSEIDIINMKTSNSVISTNLNYFIKSTLCIVNNLTDKVVYNNYIDTSLITVNSNNFQGACDLSYSTIFRGCFDINIKCNNYPSSDTNQYKLNLIYNQIAFKTSILINLDPSFPPKKSSIITSFPTSIEQGLPAKTEFSLSDENNKLFQFVQKDDLIVYLNSIILPKNEWTFQNVNGVNTISFKPIWPPKNSTIKVYYDNETNLVQMSNLTQNITILQGAPNFKKAKISLPAGIKAGDLLKFNIIIPDKNYNCYKDKIDLKLLNIILSKGAISYNKFNITQENITNSNCKSIIQVTSMRTDFITNIGLYELSFTYNNDISNKIVKDFYVVTNNISGSNSEIKVNDTSTSSITVEAGQTILINFLGMDDYSNTFLSLELIDRFNFTIPDLIQSKDYNISYAYLSSGIKIKLNIFRVGKYEISYFVDNNKLQNVAGLSTIKVISGKCSTTIPKIRPLSDVLYSGQFATFEIMCCDRYNNNVTSNQKENFKFLIKTNNLPLNKTDIFTANSIFSNGKFYAKFKPLFPGEYIITIFLGDKVYDNQYKVVVNSSYCTDEQSIMCSNRKCVNSINLCKSDIDSSCPTENPLSCSINGTKTCVKSYLNCDCPIGFIKCRGACIKESMKKAYCNIPVVNCSSILNKKAFSCPDDMSCRFDNNSLNCGAKMVCPLGYIKCGISCIQKNESCNIELPKCPAGQIICWDMTCAVSHLKCPTKKSCIFNGSSGFICPDGRCVINEFSCLPPPKCDDPTPYLCPDYRCVVSNISCQIKISCKNGEALCNNNKCKDNCLNEILKNCESHEIMCSTGECVTTLLLCPSQVLCPSGYYRCNNQVCVEKFSQCKFFQTLPSISCPPSIPILCPDLSCVLDSKDCFKISDCPMFLPYKCWNNECRSKAQDCPTIIKCPPDASVQCNDGTCRTTSYHCKTDSLVCPISKKRCFDGSCVDSLSLCPTLITCPKSLVKCWDNTCVENVRNCSNVPLSNCADGEFMCNDGSCRKNKNSCPTSSICKFPANVKCYDGTCRESLSLCPPFIPCSGDLSKSCPDGTCISSNYSCATSITCPIETPYKCDDNTCKRDRNDCQRKIIDCDEFLCPDGSCVKNRKNCQFHQSCPINNPVRCPKGNCVGIVEKCKNEDVECPMGYFKCFNGECKIDYALCPKFECPVNFPIQCPEGFCASNIKECDKENGCPYNVQIKCKNGACVLNETSCEKLDENFTCDQGMSLCKDGSCQKNCTLLQNGCNSDKPKKCADGSCVNKNDECPILTCPYNKPIKCLSGECKETSNKCPKFLSEQDYLDCDELFPSNNLIMCANGRCVHTPDECRPVYPCKDILKRCSDNSCRINYDFCPKGNKCPSTRSYQCDDGKCVKNKDDCLNFNCPADQKLCSIGKCVPLKNECPLTNSTILYNGCKDSLIKCYDGRCMNYLNDCRLIDMPCNKTTPFLCPNGQCSISSINCSNSTFSNDYIMCPDKTYVLKSEYLTKCKNRNGCPLLEPIRCIDGSCSEDQCQLSIVCPDSTPFRCEDLSCVSSIDFCRVITPCPQSKPEKCWNGICVQNNDECDTNYRDLCPISNPIKCKNGNCVDKILKCQDSFIGTCQNNQYYCAKNQACVSNYAQCVGSLIDSMNFQTNSSLLRNLFNLNLTQALENTNYINGIGKFLCYDGTWVDHKIQCPKIPPCNIMEYRCLSGFCQSNIENCNDEDLNKDLGINNLTKCIDGIYRLDCPDYDGCGDHNRFQCSNGDCVKDELECIGISMCPDPNKPYRCLDGLCTSLPNIDCEIIYKLYSTHSITQTISKYAPVKLDFSFDFSNKMIGSLYLPANSLKIENNYTQLKILPYLGSTIRNYKLKFNDSRIFKVGNSLNDTDGVLDIKKTILSTIVNITIENLESSFTTPGLIYLKHNSFNKRLFNPNDACFSKLSDDGKTWQCIQRKNNTNQNFFIFNDPGIYAVLLQPFNFVIRNRENQKPQNIILDNLTLISIITGSTFVGLIVISYIFLRILRYREKYKENQSKLINLNNQMDDFKNFSTDSPGQTIGDNILGIVYTRNPSHSIVSTNIASIQSIETKIEDLQRKCKKIEESNKSFEEKIQEVNEEYKQLKFSIDM